MKICPKDCQYRTPTCHSCCKTYADGKEKLNKQNEQMKKVKALDYDCLMTRGRVVKEVNKKRKEHNR